MKRSALGPRSFQKAGLLSILSVVGVLGGAAVYGCSASAGPAGEALADASLEPDAEDPSYTGPEFDSGEQVDASDAGRRRDSGIDANVKADSGGEGAPCTGTIEDEPCQFCGTRSRSCVRRDGGSFWSAWGPCTNQTDAATPDRCNQLELDAGAPAKCGRCGHRPLSCSSTCKLVEDSCQGEPANACDPGRKKFIKGGGCPNVDQGRVAVCEADCQYTINQACVAPPPNDVVIEVSNTKDTVINKPVLLAEKLFRLQTGSACPAAIGSIETISVHVELKNSHAVPIEVGVAHVVYPSGQVKDTIMAAYAGNVVPFTDEARKNCVKLGSNTTSEGKVDKLLIPAGGSAIIYLAAEAGNIDSSQAAIKVTTTAVNP